MFTYINISRSLSPVHILCCFQPLLEHNTSEWMSMTVELCVPLAMAIAAGIGLVILRVSVLFLFFFIFLL